MNNKKRKAIVLSMAMAAMMLSPLTMNAQYDESRYGIQPWFESSMMGKESGNRGAITGDIANDGFGNNAPIGSGLVILLGAGLGYVALKKKED